jgi:hypothetical protein
MIQPQWAFPTFSGDMVAQHRKLKMKYAHRDQMIEQVRAVRNGDLKALFPEELELNLSFQGVPIHNFIDIVAKDVSELLAPLPSVRCASGKMRTDADQRRAETKNRIADSYSTKSKLAKQMMKGADRYVSYGFLPIYVEPDQTGKRPFIHVEDPRHSYYQLDRFGQVVVYSRQWHKSIDELCAMYPEYQAIIEGENFGKKGGDHGETQLEMVRWVDGSHVRLFLPERQGLVLNSYEHKLSRAPAYIIERPGLDDIPRGQFDDVIWVQVARAIMTSLTLEAAYEAVSAPIAIPKDVDEFPIGPHSVWQTDNPQNVRRVNLELPPGVFNENQILQEELQMGSRYPDARSGNSNASVITGKGVEALLGSFTTQIAGAQAMFKDGFENIFAICFEMDEKWWPHQEKQLNGTMSGNSYEINYTPAIDIAGKYECIVTYGFSSGMQPAQAVVTMLQLDGAGIISKQTTMENMPYDIDAIQMQKQIDVEATREALKQGVFQLVQSIGPMAAQGQDPTHIISLVTQITKLRQDGSTIEDATEKAFTQYQQAIQQAQQEEQAEQQAAAQQQQPPGGAPGPGDSGSAPGGDLGQLPQGVAPGQAGMPAGGRPTIQNMIAGFRGQGSSPVLQDTIQRKVATGAP